MINATELYGAAAQHFIANDWQTGELRLICTARWQETTDVVSFRFRAAEPIKFRFKPGQFITFHLEIGDSLFHRSYTISSSPSRPHSLTVTIKRVEGGKVSNYLLDNLQPGHSLLASGPYGDFNLIDIPAERYLFLSAGCGITPVYSMTRYLTDTLGPDADICFIHSARTAADTIYRDSLHAIAEHYAGFSLGVLVQHELVLPQSERGQWLSGYLDAERLLQLAPDFLDRTVFVCGPERFMNACKSLFEALGFDMSRYHQESFGMEVSPSLKAAVGSYSLQVDGNETSLDGTQTLLEGIEALQLPIIAACRSGVCGACKCRVVEGDVASDSQQTLTADEIASGMVLACSSRPLSDIKLALGN
ncbi:hybrid-cluster NAD(P)-dependent oxidoreductase [Shewanella yunxiaonensis]|uniref:Hybrid-cluster NAD(P)-dependent oxidoreductase n=1 Tax=Shewanella yunxiaonensis TaxID=2829809 RepID=A0ABX7YQN0_9GAMM|nr:hybrid-cluster NAD(P)-dependent oxidoreductase [Shewanella yunxiaonensis]QUN04927.1 hybrid-cluster NAD(P)-dependent oxidoreductase [Shewanella yunxiaonensis]